MKKNLINLLVPILLLLSPIYLLNSTLAATCVNGSNSSTESALEGANEFSSKCASNTLTSKGGLSSTIVGTITLIAGVIIVIMIIYAGYSYIVSDGDPAKVKAAKSTLVNAIIGLVIVILARTIIYFVLGVKL